MMAPASSSPPPASTKSMSSPAMFRVWFWVPKKSTRRITSPNARRARKVEMIDDLVGAAGFKGSWSRTSTSISSSARTCHPPRNHPPPNAAFGKSTPRDQRESTPGNNGPQNEALGVPVNVVVSMGSGGGDR